MQKNGVWREGKFPPLAENSADQIYIPVDRNSRNQALGLVTSQATQNWVIYFGTDNFSFPGFVQCKVILNMAKLTQVNIQ